MALSDTRDRGVILCADPSERDGEGVHLAFFEIEGFDDAPGARWALPRFALRYHGRNRPGTSDEACDQVQSGAKRTGAHP